MSRYAYLHFTFHMPIASQLYDAVTMLTQSSLNIDASLITHHHVSQTKEKLIQLQNGCICCTLRGDLLAELARLAQQSEVQYVVIESTGISEPMQVAETFTAEFGALFDEKEMGLEEGLSDEDRDVLVDVYAPTILAGMRSMAGYT